MKYKIGLVIIVMIVVVFFAYQLYVSSIDTKYAIRFSEVFQTYDINTIDTFLSENTQLISNGRQVAYKELRNNVITACHEKIYKFSLGSSYGHGNDKFVNGVQDIEIYLYGKLNENDFGECNLKMKLRRKGLFSSYVESIECNEPIFEYLFFGKISNNDN